LKKQFRFSDIVKSAMLAEIPVMFALALWIWFRAADLVRLSKDLPAGFLVPRTVGEAVRNGCIIWLVVSLTACFAASGIYQLLICRLNWRPIYFTVLLVGVALAVSVFAFVSGMVFAVEATGELLIVALGFGLFIPWLSDKKLFKKL
jgi:hypothetical protein